MGGTQVAQVVDTASAGGKVGYSCGYHYARFDNLRIARIPGETTTRLVRAVATSEHPGHGANCHPPLADTGGRKS